MKKYFKIINVTRRQLALFLIYLATLLFASAGIITVMTYGIAYPGGNNFVIYNQDFFKTSLILPLVFFVVFAISGLAILLTGKETYKFDHKLVYQTYKFKSVLTLIEIIQAIAWAFFLGILIVYFYPINKSLSQVYQDQVANVNFAKDNIKSDLISFIQIKNNFFADLKLSILNYAATLPYFFNKDSFAFWNIIYFALYIALFIPYLKLNLFKKHQRYLALVPFASLFLNLKAFNNFNQQDELIIPNETGLKWYQKILLSNKIAFRIKLTGTVIYLSFFYLIGVLIFAIYAAFSIIKDGPGYTLVESTTYQNAYSIDFLTNVTSEVVLLRILRSVSSHIMMITFIVFTMGIILDDNPYVFSKTIRKSKLRLSLTLIAIEIAQWAFLILVYLFYSRNGALIIGREEPMAAFGIITTSIKSDQTGIIYSARDTFITTNLFFVALYMSWFLIYAKAGMFSKKTRLLMYLPFATLFFVNKHVLNTNQKEQININVN
ncbi:hypothetical protein H3143_01135 [Mycoplasma tullyi]|uniref:Uncharacterized protein n=1 Tax=Mycoplasma tullyi TaxID=1612150 RepID=A0A7D7YM11_9MOLU|nr:hypothetical protein [Mycoplasma tullyi]QMT98722.1 hypothetical protein H3143_01135 [Mycoplasma tullyi]